VTFGDVESGVVKDNFNNQQQNSAIAADACARMITDDEI
jgi:hypothetical protein